MSSDSTTSGVPVGTIISCATNPGGNWLLCDGSEIDSSNYPALTDMFGTHLPNLGGMSLVGFGTRSDPDGSKTSYKSNVFYGLDGTTLTLENMPTHQHYGWGESTNSGQGLVTDQKAWGFGTSTGSNWIGSGSSDGGNFLYGSSWAGGVSKGDNVLVTTYKGENYASFLTDANTTKPFLPIPPSYCIGFYVLAR